MLTWYVDNLICKYGSKSMSYKTKGRANESLINQGCSDLYSTRSDISHSFSTPIQPSRIDYPNTLSTRYVPTQLFKVRRISTGPWKADQPHSCIEWECSFV
jgi:hypothetical protein